jgi:hypothetical protein
MPTGIHLVMQEFELLVVAKRLLLSLKKSGQTRKLGWLQKRLPRMSNAKECGR